ncbi:Major facilitator superfamily domain, general substrate transporter [Pseudocohnilembus persalinus]|uniref:Major facilitator superfamily domain, general substrate transporter n=1 Tax=Pseudocohnilembus persalinus TaxID=266149 RepID=A0A0V0R0M6_PSEPJ|nr:Major facilitator superfamily domain, general substrate transporter [Pseudocohnilembus persalinus]|eukprot:KRX08051.1 Major facilitator superfamily domain, general substrate transporter [Pseudocohnilembus persalinus]
MQQNLSIFDHIIENKVKVGLFQLRHLAILVLIDSNDGAQLVLMSFIMPILQHEWNLSNFQISILTSIFYLGTSIGSCYTGKIADVKGRRYAIKWSSLSLFICSICFYVIQDVYQMALIRLIYGMIYGISLPLTTSMFSEIIPMQYRGKGLVIINLFVSVGKIVGCLFAWICLDNFSSGNWRLMMVLSSFPSLIVFWGSFYVLSESPRFLVASKQIDEGIEVLNKMIVENNKSQGYAELVTSEEKQELINWQEKHFEHHRENGPSPSMLFKDELKGVTIRMWICWFIENAMYFGQLVILPFILGKSHKSFGQYIITVFGEIPSILVSLYVIDIKGLGRKNSLTIWFSLSAVMHFATYYGSKDYLSTYASIARFFMKLAYAMLYPLSTELYPTLLRTYGFGYCSGIGRLGATLIPYLIFGIMEWDLYSSFFIFFVISIIAAISSGTLPYDTLGRNLDKDSEMENEQQNQKLKKKDSRKQSYEILDVELIDRKSIKQNQNGHKDNSNRQPIGY